MEKDEAPTARMILEVEGGCPGGATLRVMVMINQIGVGLEVKRLENKKIATLPQNGQAPQRSKPSALWPALWKRLGRCGGLEECRKGQGQQKQKKGGLGYGESFHL